MVTKTSV